MSIATGTQLRFNRELSRRTVLGLGSTGIVAAGAVAAAMLNSNNSGDSSTSGLAAVTTPPATPMPDATPLASGLVRDTLMQSSYTAEGIAFDLLLAPPVFFESIHRPDEATLVGADTFVVFLLAEHHYHEDSVHNGHFSLMPILQLDKTDIHVARKTVLMSDDGHHRVTALVFEELPVAMTAESHTWEMLLPPDANGQRAILTWITPIDFSVTDSSETA